MVSNLNLFLFQLTLPNPGQSHIGGCLVLVLANNVPSARQDQSTTGAAAFSNSTSTCSHTPPLQVTSSCCFVVYFALRLDLKWIT